jgi:hypothetical protein
MRLRKNEIFLQEEGFGKDLQPVGRYESKKQRGEAPFLTKTRYTDNCKVDCNGDILMHLGF